MSIIRITEGEHITNIEGSWTVFTDTFEASAGQFSHFTAEKGTNLGNPADAPKVTDNAFIPILTPINDENDIFKSYEIVVNEKEEWTFDSNISENLRKQKSHDVKFKNSSYGARVKFKVEKGNPTANDDDGGNITILFFRDGETQSFQSDLKKDVKYGDTLFVDWDASKGVTQIQFYADDNDFYFDGDVKNVYCGAAKLKGSKVGRWLTRNIENLPIAKPGEHLPNTDEYTFGHPQESIDIANKFQNCLGMCFAVSMARVGKAYNDYDIVDAITVATKGEDYIYSGTVSKNIPDQYFGYGVGGALAKNGYAELVSHEDVWNGKLEEGAMIQYWNNHDELKWENLKGEIKKSLQGRQTQYFNGGHSVIFKSYIYNSTGVINGMKFYDYTGIHREFLIFDKTKKIMLGANLKDKK